MSLDEMLTFVPQSEKTDDNQKVSLWYAQAESMTQFMLERGGRNGFAQFLPALRDGQSFDQAIGSSYVGVWGDLPGFYRSWQAGAP
jgi:hypothetical protein